MDEETNRTTNVEDEIPDNGAELGTRIRELRTRRGLSLAQLAEKTQTSRSLISQVERGTASPSVETLHKLASALEVPIFSLFLNRLDSETVVRVDNRRQVSYPGSNVQREILSPGLNGRMVLLWVTFPPREQSGTRPVHHTGEECIVVVRGTIDVLISDNQVRLNEGDSITFDSELPHTFYNPTDETTEAIVAISPPVI